MPPSAKRASRARREPRKAVTSNADISPGDVEDSSPSRPAKRPDIDLPEQVQEDEDPPAPNDDQLVSQITQHLRSQEVQASKDHANVIHEAKGDGVKAYAKVAAQDWTFYITKLNVNIGRAPETSHNSQTAGSDEDESYVHIDLGPSKMVSREHATISFDSKDEKWFLHVKGRNGAKVDSQPVKAGQAHPLTSGEVIEIGNVEMMFVLPSEITPLTVHPIYLQRAGSTAKSPAASTPAVMVGANGVDLSQDENQHIKPQYSYAQMITQAILNAPDGKLNLNGIYTYIMNTYAYYRHQQAAGWQNSIRHNLSLNKSFDKVARLTDEPGKGMKWQIVPEAREEMIRNAYRVGRGGHRGSSAPSSPNQLAYITHGPRDMASRETPSARRRRASPPASPQPPGSSLLIPQSTPDRSFGRNATMMIDGSPLPRPRKTPARDSSFSVYNPQSPTLTSSYQEDGGSFVTPAPPRMHPKLAPPSTAQRPSQHMPTSSPAPFWKYADIGSTPLKPLGGYDVSPTKAGGVLPPQSSSPPRGDKSPLSSPSRPQKSSPQPIAQPAEAEEEHGFDLTKGFQSIGAYHAPVGGGASILQGRT
ncbi:forkhead protein [Fusarium fujikuroi]|nr:forkhead protein [Fusarium fujikuroi]